MARSRVPSRYLASLPQVPFHPQWRQYKVRTPHRVNLCLRLRTVAYGVASVASESPVTVKRCPTREVRLLTYSNAEKVVWLDISVFVPR